MLEYKKMTFYKCFQQSFSYPKTLTHSTFNKIVGRLLYSYVHVFETVPDKTTSRILEVVVVRRIFKLGTGNLEWGGNGKGLRKGRSVYE